MSGNRFSFEKAKGVPIAKLDSKGKPTGKIRPIVLAPVESRIVQRAILNVLVDQEGLKPFFLTPYSFGGIRSARKRGEQSRSDQSSAVPGAIKSVVEQIGEGRSYIASADIRSFFTRISKDYVVSIISSAIGDDVEFVNLLRQAINVELDNISQLKSLVIEFPTEDIGVAQGNSLSPLLGNIALAEFDRIMNTGDCRCIRYIDDFVIMAPTIKAANARLAKAIQLLSSLGMDLSPEKSSKGATPIDHGFDFLGVHVRPGLIRPSTKAQLKFLKSISSTFEESKKAMIATKNGALPNTNHDLIATLKRVRGMIEGWGKTYWFCNDGQVFKNMDTHISTNLTSFLGTYSAIRDQVRPELHMVLLGMVELARLPRQGFTYPSRASRPSP